MPRFSCALNGVSPDTIDPALFVTDVTELAPRRRVTSAPASGHGLRLLRRVRESLTVRIHFLIAEYDPARRRELITALHAWADPGGYLTISDRPGLRLQVVCDTLPIISALSWSDELIIEFTAYESPFWEDVEQTIFTITDTTTVTPPGNVEDCPVLLQVRNTGAGAMTSLAVLCGSTHLSFQGMALPAGGIAILLLSNGQLAAIMATGESFLHCRTADSSDLLLADGGVPTDLSVSGDQPLEATFWMRGRYL